MFNLKALFSSLFSSGQDQSAFGGKAPESGSNRQSGIESGKDGEPADPDADIHVDGMDDDDERWDLFGSGHQPDRPLSPHVFQTRATLLFADSPKILILPEAYQIMQLYVELAPHEVGWVGTVTRTAGGDFIIDQTFLLEQEVGPAHTDLTGRDLDAVTRELLNKGAEEEANRLRFWGHSHVHFGAFPSGTDENTMAKRYDEEFPWYVRGILNKLGDARFDIFFYDQGVSIRDVPWVVWDPDKGVLLEHKPKVADRFPSPSLRYTAAPMGMLQGAATKPQAPPPRPPIPKELIPSEELRARVHAEYKDKVTEKKMYEPLIELGKGMLGMILPGVISPPDHTKPSSDKRTRPKSEPYDG